jgi:hypothetical protein
MNRKIIFSLILFIGVFFAFGMKVKAANCEYYGVESYIGIHDVEKHNLVIYNVGTDKATVIENDKPPRYNVKFDGDFHAGKCPIYIHTYVNVPLFSSGTYIVYASYLRTKEDGIGTPQTTYQLNDRDNPTVSQPEGTTLCKYKSGGGENIYINKLTDGNKKIYKNSRDITDLFWVTPYSGSAVVGLDAALNSSSCLSYIYYNYAPTFTNYENNGRYYFCKEPNCYKKDPSRLENGEIYTEYKYTGATDTTYEPVTNGETDKYTGIGGKPVENTCEGILGRDFIDFLNDYIFTPLKIISPILLLILTTLDFAKAVFADDKDALKKAQSNFVKRTAAVIILFLLTYILDLIFTVISNGMIDSCL